MRIAGNTERWLDTVMQKCHGPPHPVPGHHLACGGPQSIAGKIRAAPLRSVRRCGTPPLALAHRAPGARGVSDAKGHALAGVSTRRQTPGGPRAPTMTTETRVEVAPLSRWGGERALPRCRCGGCAGREGSASFCRPWPARSVCGPSRSRPTPAPPADRQHRESPRGRAGAGRPPRAHVRCATREQASGHPAGSRREAAARAGACHPDPRR